MTELDDIFEELKALAAEREAGVDVVRLAEISARKDDLQKRLEDVRYRYVAPPSRRSLERELAARVRQLDDIDDQKIRLAANAGGGDFGDGYGSMHALNRQIDSANDRDAIRKRIIALRDQLAELDRTESDAAAIEDLRSDGP